MIPRPLKHKLLGAAQALEPRLLAPVQDVGGEPFLVSECVRLQQKMSEPAIERASAGAGCCGSAIFKVISSCQTEIIQFV